MLSMHYIFFQQFIMEDKARARGEDVKRCRCCERQRAKDQNWKSWERRGEKLDYQA